MRTLNLCLMMVLLIIALKNSTSKYLLVEVEKEATKGEYSYFEFLKHSIQFKILLKLSEVTIWFSNSFLGSRIICGYEPEEFKVLCKGKAIKEMCPRECAQYGQTESSIKQKEKGKDSVFDLLFLKKEKTLIPNHINILISLF